MMFKQGANTMISATPDATFYRNILRSVIALPLDGSHPALPGLTRNTDRDLALLTHIIMKAKVYVTLKPSVLDPQGKAIKHSVELLGFSNIQDVRQGKYFEIAVDSSRSPDEARADAERLARDVLSNPIIEDFRIEIEQ